MPRGLRVENPARIQLGAAQPPQPRGVKPPHRVDVLPGRSRSAGTVLSSGSVQGQTATNDPLTDCGYFRPTTYPASKIYVWICFM